MSQHIKTYRTSWDVDSVTGHEWRGRSVISHTSQATVASLLIFQEIPWKAGGCLSSRRETKISWKMGTSSAVLGSRVII